MPASWKVPLIVLVSVTGTFWLIAASLLAASWRSTGKVDRIRNAPICARSEALSNAVCQITLPGTVTKITGGELDVTVDGQSLASTVTLSGKLPDASQGIPVEVTLYRGRVIHVEGETGLSVDTSNAPSTQADGRRVGGILFLVLGFGFGLYCMGKTIEARNEA